MEHQLLAISLLTTFAALVVAFGLGWWVGYSRAQQCWWNEMIRRRHAEYHWEDGKVYWIADLPKTPRDPIAAKVAAADRERWKSNKV